MEILRVRADAVDDWEGEFALGQVFAESFVLGVVGAMQVHVVIADLEYETYEVYEMGTVPRDRNSVGVCAGVSKSLLTLYLHSPLA